MRTQHRRQQADRGGLAVGTGDNGFRDRAQARPRHRIRSRQGIQRPCLRGFALADREQVVVRMRGDAMRTRGFDQRAQRRLRFRRGERLQPAQGVGVIEMGDMRARRRGFVVHRRIGCADTERRIQRPLVHFGGDVELVGRRREGKRCAAGMFAHDDRARGPTERCPRPRDVVAPALPGVGIECQSGRGFQRRAGAIEVEVGAGQPARILERFAHDARLNRTLRARSAARARRAPRLPSPRPVARPGWSPAAAPRCARWRRACRHPA